MHRQCCAQEPDISLPLQAESVLHLFILYAGWVCAFLILLLRGGCTPPKTGEHGGGEYPKGKVVAIRIKHVAATIIKTCSSDTNKIRSTSAATTPPVGHPSSPEEGNWVTSPASDVKIHKFIPRVVYICQSVGKCWHYSCSSSLLVGLINGGSSLLYSSSSGTISNSGGVSIVSLMVTLGSCSQNMKM